MVRLSFGGGSFTGPDVLEANAMEQLAAAERRLGVESEYLTAAGRFAYLLEALHRQTGQRVAVLVDEAPPLTTSAPRRCCSRPVI